MSKFAAFTYPSVPISCFIGTPSLMQQGRNQLFFIKLLMLHITPLPAASPLFTGGKEGGHFFSCFIFPKMMDKTGMEFIMNQRSQPGAERCQSKTGNYINKIMIAAVDQ